MLQLSTHIAQTVNLTYDPSLPQSAYAAIRLKTSLLSHGYTITTRNNQGDYCINLGINHQNPDPEPFTIQMDGKTSVFEVQILPTNL